MATPVDTLTPTNYTQITYTKYTTLQDKVNALLGNNVLLIKNFEQAEGSDVLIQLATVNGFQVSQISYDTQPTSQDPSYFVTFNVGLNDLSLMTVFLWNQTAFSYSNRYMIGDTVDYTNSAGVADAGVITGIYVSNIDPNQFAYSVSNDTAGIYAESDLIQQKYQ